MGKQKNTGFSVSTNGTQLGNISGEHSKGDMRSNYTCVTEQAGIFAGKDDYIIITKGISTLEGAVIDSKATAEKNTVSTGRLAMKDIENTAEYSSKNTGISYNHIGNFKSLSQAGQDAVYNSLGLLPKLLPESKNSAHSTTKSAIADGTITVHDESVDIRSISRDTANSLNKLDKIFDKKKVEERQELARLFAKDAFEQLHYWEPKTKEEKVAKAIAHGVVAEVSARVAGNKPGSGFYAGVTNEALIGEIQKVAKTNPAVAQWLSAGVGALVNAGLGKPVITGAAEAQYGTRDNAYGRMKQSDELSEFESYYIIALDGGVYKRSRAGDELVDPSVLSTDFISGVVVQNPEKGHQLEGQEVLINSDLSWTNIDEPMGKVHPWDEWTYKSKGHVASQGEYSEAFSRAVSEDMKRRESEPYVRDTWYDKDTLMAYNEYSDGSTVSLGMTWGQLLETQGYPTKVGADGAFYTGSSTTGWHYNPNPSESSRHRVVWQGYQADDGQYYNLLADGSKVLTGEYKGNYNAKAGQAIEFDEETRTFSSGGFPIFPDGDPDLIKSTSWIEFQASLGYAVENGMLIAGGNSVGRGLFPKSNINARFRHNSGNSVRYVREYPRTGAGYYGASSRTSGKSFIREIPGGSKEARRFFESETKGYVREEIGANGHIIRFMPDGRRIGYRPVSKSGDSAVDFSDAGPNKPYQKIHFPE